MRSLHAQGALRRMRLMALAVAAAGVLVLPSFADANYVYWTNQNGTSIGRAKLNGTGVNNNFITGLNLPSGIATDSTYIYWMQGDATNATIGRANLDGTGANPNFIPHQAGMNAGGGVSISPTNGIYWGNKSNTIGHANLDGSSANPALITGPAAFVCGVATDSSFLYFLNTAPTHLNRVPLAGGSPTVDFVTGTNNNCGIGVDSNYIYYGANLQRIGRAPIGGGAADPNFITGATTANNPCGMGVNSQYLFWGNSTSSAVGRADLDGKNVSPTLIQGATNACFVTAAPSNKVTVTSQKLNTKKGTAKISAKVPGPGQAELTTTPTGATEAGTVKKVGLTLTAGGPFSLPVKPQGKASKRLKKKGKSKVTVYVDFTPAGVNGVTNSLKQVIVLKKKLKKPKK